MQFAKLQAGAIDASEMDLGNLGGKKKNVAAAGLFSY